MEYITLENSDLSVSRFCVGGCPMGGYGWGNVQKAELLDSIRIALEKGVNFFDTADTYGLGESERTLAEGFPTVFTLIGLFPCVDPLMLGKR